MKRNTIIRIEILTQCYGYRPASRSIENIIAMMRREGEIRDAIPREIAAEVDYLVGKGWLAEDPLALAAGEKRWCITSAGIDYFESMGLV